MPLSDSLRSDVCAVIEQLGADCEEISARKVGNREQITVVVDKDGGVDLDTVAEISSALSALLDDADGFDEPFVLEVTSPGVDRPLTLPRHWARARGRLVEVSLGDGTSLTGRITEADAESATVTVTTKGRSESLRIPYGDVVRAVVQVEFSKPGEER